jgi:hypothetical protein
MQKSLIIGLILFSNALSAGSSIRLTTQAAQRLRSSMTPVRSSFTSFKPGQSPQLRTFVTKSYKPTNISLVGNKTFSGSLAQRGISTQLVQRSVTPSGQGGYQSFNAKYLIPLAAVFGLAVAPKGSVLGEEYTAQEAARLIGFNDINDLADPNNILAFLNKDDYKNNAALFSIIVADNVQKILPALEDTLRVLQDNKSEKSLERIRFLNQVILDINDRNKVEWVKTKMPTFKQALESLLIVEYERPDGTKFKGKVGSFDYIKPNSTLSQMIKGLNNDSQLRAHFLRQLSTNTAGYWGYSGGLNDVEKQFKEAYESFKTLPQAYKDLAEMIVQDQRAYDNVKNYAAYLPTLFNAVKEAEEVYRSQSNELPKQIERKQQEAQLGSQIKEPVIAQEQPGVVPQEEKQLAADRGSLTQRTRQWFQNAKKNFLTRFTESSQKSSSSLEIY